MLFQSFSHLNFSEGQSQTKTTNKTTNAQYEDYRCSDQVCHWTKEGYGITWGFYLMENGGKTNCEECTKACTEDPKCDAVECGDWYCGWWSGQCLYPDMDDSDDDLQTCVKGI